MNCVESNGNLGPRYCGHYNECMGSMLDGILPCETQLWWEKAGVPMEEEAPESLQGHEPTPRRYVNTASQAIADFAAAATDTFTARGAATATNASIHTARKKIRLLFTEGKIARVECIAGAWHYRRAE